MKRILVVGCPRSGTTLVQQLLSTHKEVFTCPETHYFQNVRRRGRRRILDHLFLSRRNVLRAYRFVCSEVEMLGRYDPGTVASLPDAVRFFDHMMTSEAKARGKSAWVEKTPGHLLHARLIKRYIPSLLFVHVFRDGRDVVASLVDAAERFPQVWKRYGDLDESIAAYNLFLRESLSYWDQDGHVFIGYEDILDDPVGAYRRLLALLGLESADLHLGSDRMRQSIVRSDESWKGESEGEIRDTRLVKFNQVFNREQRTYVENRLSVLSPELALAIRRLEIGNVRAGEVV